MTACKAPLPAKPRGLTRPASPRKQSNLEIARLAVAAMREIVERSGLQRIDARTLGLLQ